MTLLTKLTHQPMTTELYAVLGCILCEPTTRPAVLQLAVDCTGGLLSTLDLESDAQEIARLEDILRELEELSQKSELEHHEYLALHRAFMDGIGRTE